MCCMVRVVRCVSCVDGCLLFGACACWLLFVGCLLVVVHCVSCAINGVAINVCCLLLVC